MLQSHTKSLQNCLPVTLRIRTLHFATIGVGQAWVALVSLSGTPRSLRLKLTMAVVGALCLLLVFSAGISYGVSGNGDGEDLTGGTEEPPSASTDGTTAQPSE